MTKLYQPNDIKTLVGISPDTLRDWRRRKLLDAFGVYALPGGGWTTRPDDPALAGVGRPTWGYLRGDLLGLAIAKGLSKLGLDLATAFRVARLAVSYVAAWLDPNGLESFRHPRFLVAWPADEGENHMGAPVGGMTAVRLDDLNRLPLYSGANAIVIDFERTAQEMSAGLRALYREGGDE